MWEVGRTCPYAKKRKGPFGLLDEPAVEIAAGAHRCELFADGLREAVARVGGGRAGPDRLGQVRREDRPVAGDGQGVLHRILQLAAVARPGVLFHGRGGIGGQRGG